MPRFFGGSIHWIAQHKRHRLSRHLDPLTYAKLTEMLSRLNSPIIQHGEHLAASQGPDGTTQHDLDQALETFWQAVDALRNPAID